MAGESYVSYVQHLKKLLPNMYFKITVIKYFLMEFDAK